MGRPSRSEIIRNDMRQLFPLCLALFAAAAVAAGAGTASSAPPGPGLWSNGANLIAGREQHTATLLPDGRVLVVGGTDGRGTALASAEIYDPRANRWVEAGSMATTRIDHTATLLPNGKVLVVGGMIGPIPSNTLGSAELYDPATNTWSSAAPMTGSRARHTATLLRDGRVLVVGGLSFIVHDNNLFPNQPDSAEIYDPVANRWTVTSATRFYRIGHSATLLRDGRVLVAGGSDNSDPTPFTASEVYDPRQARWIDAGSMGAGRSGHGATLLANGDVLVVGGLGAGTNLLPTRLRDVEFYHPQLDAWTALASTTEVHVGDTLTLLKNGKVLVLGSTSQSRAEIFDPDRNHWSATGPLMVRYNHTATRLADGRVLVVGGYGLESLATVLLYDPKGVAPVEPKPLDARVVAALLLLAVLVLATVAWSMPSVRQRLRHLRPAADSDEWIS